MAIKAKDTGNDGGGVGATVEMADDHLHRLLSELVRVRSEKARLEKAEKDVLSRVKSVVDSVFDGGAGRVLCTDFVLSRVGGVHRVVSPDLLLERGVAPDVVLYATKVTNYFQYRVTGW